MKKINPLEFQTGFLMGAFLGFFIQAIFLIFYNIVLTNLFEWQKIYPHWWWYLPIPIITGIIMGSSIANLHLEDY